MKLEILFNHSKFSEYAAFLKSTGLSDSSINRKLSSLSSFEKFLIKKKLIDDVRADRCVCPSSGENTNQPKQKLFSSIFQKIKLPLSQSNNFNPKSYFLNLKTNFLFRYLAIFTLFVISAGLGFTLYRQAFTQSKKDLAYSTAANPISGGRFLSFQGRLTDSSGNPIQSSTGIIFKLYTSDNGGTLLYTSDAGNSQTVVPDDNGIFSVTIGKSHGNTIPSSVFSENAEVWLEITAGGETMSPRQAIATVAYALNAETLQGMPPSAVGTSNTVLIVDGMGNVNLGETSPSIISKSGTFGIEGQAVLLKASDGSGGNITINPDGNGSIKLITEGSSVGTSSGFIDATNANLTSGNLFNASINNLNKGYNFINFSNYSVGTSLISRFSVDAYGNTNVGGTLSTSNLSIGSSSLVSNLNSDLLDGFHASYFMAASVGSSYTYTASNGLSLASNNFKLGGLLTENTDIGFSGFSLTFSDAGSTLVSFSSTGNTFYNPTSFLSSGDVSIAYDLNLTNATASYIKSQAPLYIQTESPYANLDLNLTAANAGIIYLNSDANLTKNLTVGGTFVSVGSTNLVTNLNSDLLDGFHSSYFMPASVGSSYTYTAGNGLTLTSGNQFKLGGSLTEATRFNIGSTEVMYFSTAGNIGIGKTSPLNKVDINGSINVDGKLKIYQYDTLTYSNTNLIVGGIGYSNAYFGNTGNVGIGTTNPTHKLTINDGNLNITGNSLATAIRINGITAMGITSTGEMRFNGTSGKGFVFTPNDTNTVAMSMLSNGNVGIGTTNPNSKLEILGSSTYGGHLGTLMLRSSTSSNKKLYAGFDDTLNAGFIQSVDTGNVWLPTLLNPNGGNVGIGTTAPSKKLDVAGDINLTGTIFSAGTSGSNGQILTSTGAGLLWVNASGIGGTYTASNGISLVGSNFKLGGALTEATRFNIGSTEVMYLSTSGKVGIGTSSPTTKLQVAQDWTDQYYYSSQLSVGGATDPLKRLYMGIDTTNNVGRIQVAREGAAYYNLALNPSGGNVGIGTTAPSTKLHVYGGAIRVDGNGEALGIYGSTSNVKLTGDTPFGTVYTSVSGLSLGAGSTAPLMTILSSGNVGIGTTAPLSGYKLDVNGYIASSDTVNGGMMYFAGKSGTGYTTYFDNRGSSFDISQQNVGTRYTRILSTGTGTLGLTVQGNVGIGTTTPGHKLDVIGDGSFSTNLDVGGTLTLTQGAAAGYILQSIDATGKAKWVSAVGIGGTYTSSNGLSLVGNDFRLGGLLTENTDIGFSGFSLTFSDAGSTLVSFSSAGNTFYNPTSFLSSGDVSIAYDLNLTNSGGSNLNSAGPLVINVGEVFNSSNLTLQTYNAGKIILASSNLWNDGTYFGVGTTNPTHSLDVIGDANISTNLNVGTGITTPKITLTSGANAGYLLQSDASGNASWVTAVGIGGTYTASNGITVTGSNFKLGGALTEATRFNIGSTEVMYLSTAGNVGIGNTSPTSQLHLSTSSGGNVVDQITLQNTSTSDNSGESILFKTWSNNTARISTLASPASWFGGSLQLQTNNNISNTWNTGLVINGLGNVGIGTTNPGGELDVSSSNTQLFRVNTWNTGVNLDNMTSGGILYMGRDQSGAGALHLGPSNSQTVLYIPTGSSTGAGNVGIGTTAPGAKLEVNGNLKFTANNSAISMGAKMLINSSTNLKFTAPISGQNYIFDNYAGTDLVTFTDSGSVGIGTTAPGYKLEIIGDGRFSTNLSVGGTLTLSQGASAGYILQTDNSGNASWVDFASSGLGTTYAAGSGLTLSSETFKLGGALTENMRLNIGSTEAFFINYSNGNIGIGTTNPTVKLEINKASTGSNTGFFNIFNTGSNNTGTGSNMSFFAKNDSGIATEQTRISSYLTNGSDSQFASHLQFFTSSAGSLTEKLRITNVGNVGIGNTNPTELLTLKTTGVSDILSVSGGSISSRFIFNTNWNAIAGNYLGIRDSSSSNPQFIFTDGGRLGIGTTAPGHKLEIIGDASISTNLSIGGTLTLSQGAQNGYILQTDNSGNASWVDFATSGLGTTYSAGSGLTLVDETFKLGGALTENMRLNIGSTEALFINYSNGNIGLGTTNADSVLRVVRNQDAATDFRISNSNNNASARSGIFAGVAGSSAYTISYPALGLHPLTGVFGTDSGLTNGMLLKTAAGDITFAPTSTTAVTIKSGGNVGIGTTNPITKLNILGGDDKDTGPVMRLSGNSANQFESGRIRFTEDNGGNGYLGGFIQYNGLANIFNIGTHSVADSLTTNDINAITIARDSGYIGIGTTSPESLLHLNLSTTGSAGPILYLDNSSTSNLNNSSDIRFSTWSGESVSNPGAKISLVNTSAASGANAFTFYTKNTSGVVAERVRFDSQGNVGIGTTSPTRKLEVYNSTVGDTEILLMHGAENGLLLQDLASADMASFLGYNGTTYNAIEFRAKSGYGSQLVLATSGNIGIGTTAPGYKLDVIGDGSFSTNLSIGGSLTLSQGAQNGYILQTDNSGNASWINFATSGLGTTYSAGSGLTLSSETFKLGGSLTENMRLNIGDTEALFINYSNGYIGIGTTSPLTQFHITGQMTSTLETGTSPFAVTSTTVNTNLNADMLDGLHNTDFASVTDSVYYIEGTGTTIGTWLGSNSKISSYYEGLTIRYYIPIAGTSTNTLNINNLGAKTIYLYGSTKLTTHYPALSVITLTYSTKNSGSWFVAPYYADGAESYTVRWNSSVTNNSTDINHGYKLTFEKPDGTFAPVSVGNGTAANSNIISSQTFKLGGQTLYYGTTTDIGVGVTYLNTYEGVNSAEMEYWSNRGATAWATIGLPFYLVAIPSDDGDTFTLVGSGTTDELGTQTLPTTEDGLIYIQIGFMGSTTDSWRLSTLHPIFEFKNGVLRQYLPKKNKMNSLFVMNNVGIGTTNPLYKLDVVGDANISTNLSVGGTFNLSVGASAGYILQTDNSGNASWVNFASSGLGTTYSAGSGLTLSSETFKLGGALTEDMRLNIGNTEAFFINYSNGNIGLGTTTPLEKLDLAGNMNISGTLKIGTTADDGNLTGLQIKGFSDYRGCPDVTGIGSSFSGGGTFIMPVFNVYGYKTTNGVKVYSNLPAVKSEPGALFTTVSVYWNNMNVDGYILHVTTSNKWKDVGNVFSYTDSGSLVGFTTGTPDVSQKPFGSSSDLAHFYNSNYDFKIKGDGQIVSNTPVGTKPFDIVSTTLNTNLNADLLDGLHASSFVSSIPTGDLNLNNFYITNGTQPGNSNFIGNGAGTYAVGASYSNFLGSSAGYQGQAASNSNFLGRLAGYFAITASNSNFFGDSAGTYAQSASYSNFLGSSAGSWATSASNSNFLGQNAGQNASFASNSNFLGQSAGKNAIRAKDSIFIGSFAGIGDSVNNTDTGTSGGTSIAIGRYAGTGGFSNSIAIGRGVVNSTNNQMNLGNVMYLSGLGATDTQSSAAIAGAKVGIGTTIPQYKLDVIGDGSFSTNLSVGGTLNLTGTNVTGTGTTALFIDAGGVVTKRALGSLAFADTAIGTTYAATNGLTLSSGNVFGLGGTLTQHTSIGTSSFSFRMTGLGGTEAFYVSPAGNFSVGTTNSIAKFTLQGDNSVANSDFSLLNANGSIGFEIRTGLTDLNNIFIGIGVGKSNTTGQHNIGIGDSSLSNNTTGSKNMAIGFNALAVNTTGYDNLALGYLSLSNNTTGWNNSAVGPYSLMNNTSGIFNTAQGSFALARNTIGNYNSAMGYASLYENIDGSYNSSIGNWALQANTSGSFNNAIGYVSLNKNTTGSNNLAIGNFALYNKTTGSDNLAIGNGAGENLSVGSSNIFIGNNNGATGSYSNRLYIGSGQSPIIYGNLSNGRVGIGTTNPLYKLDVAGDIGTSGAVYSEKFLSIGDTKYGLYANVSDLSQTSLSLAKNGSIAFNYINGTNIAGGAASKIQNFVDGLLLSVGTGSTASGSSTTWGQQLFLSNSDKVGIGTTAPTARLTVLGDNNALNSDFTLLNADGSLNLGIKTGLTDRANIFIGNGGSNNTGQMNTSLGNGALTSNTNGSYNSAIGYASLSQNSTGISNTAQGSHSLNLNTTGSNNVSIGYLSLGTGTTLNNNIAIGSQAGINLSVGSNNIFLGNDVGASGSYDNRLYIGNGQSPIIYGDLSNGRVGIGTTNPLYKLDINGGIRLTEGGIGSSNGISFNELDNDTGIYSLSDGNFQIATDNNYRLTILAGGNVGIGTTNPTSKLHVKGTVCLDLDANGTCLDDTSSLSDSRLKTNITNINDSMLIINQLRGVRFNWTGENNTGTAASLGFIAQEVEKILPELIITDTDGYKRLDYAKITAVLTAGIQEQQGQIEDLKSKIPDLSITSTGQINVNMNVSDQVLSSLGYSGAKNEIENATYKLTDTTGNIVNKIAQFGEIASAKIKTGFLSATNIVTKNIVAEKIISPKANITELTSEKIEVTDTLATNNLVAKDATVSTLYADNIISKEGSFGDLMTAKVSSLRDELKKIIDDRQSTTDNQTAITGTSIMSQSSAWSMDIASDSAKINGELSLTNNLVVGAKLMVQGDTQLGNAFVTGTFTTGEIAIKDNLIETTNSALYIQPSNTGSVHIMGDTLVIADNGSVEINGDLKVNGSLMANLIVADEIQTQKLTSTEINSNQIKIATDSAQTIIAETGFAAIATSSAKLTSNATAGTAVLPAGKSEIIITNNKLTANSMVYLTPVGSTKNQVPYIKSKIVYTDSDLQNNPALQDSFTIALDNYLDQDIEINWWIIN